MVVAKRLRKEMEVSVLVRLLMASCTLMRPFCDYDMLPAHRSSERPVTKKLSCIQRASPPCLNGQLSLRALLTPRTKEVRFLLNFLLVLCL
jgi:hypothetical protein